MLVRPAWRLARRLIQKRANARESVLLVMTMALSSFVIASLNLFSLNVQQSLRDDISQFLGAPLVVRSDVPFAKLAFSHPELQSPVITRTFTTGATSAYAYQTVSLKAVSSTYPVQGRFAVQLADNMLKHHAADLEPNSAWLDQRAMQTLNLGLGDTVKLGRAEFVVSGEILAEPDRLTQLQHTLPRIMINLKALANTGVNEQNNRGEYRLLYSGSTSALEQLKTNLRATRPELEVLTADSGRHPFARIAARASNLLHLVFAFLVLIAGTTVATLSKHLLNEFSISATVLRAMGVGKSVVISALGLIFSATALLASTLGYLGAFLTQPWLLSLAEPHMTLTASKMQFAQWWPSLLLAVALVIGFVVPGLLALSRVPVTAALQQIKTNLRSSYLSSVLVGLALTVWLWLSSDNPQLTTLLIGTVMLVVILTMLFGWILTKLTAQWHRVLRGPLKIAIRSLGRSAHRNTAPLVTVAITVLAVLLTTTLRGSFLDTLHLQSLDQDGNYIFTNLPAAMEPEFRQHLAANFMELRQSHPVVRAVLTHINGVEKAAYLSRESETREQARSAVNLSYADALPKNNRLLEGSWPRSINEVSVESEVMADLDLKLGDTLRFAIGARHLDAKITSRREFQAGGSRMMFWFMFAPQTLRDYPQTRMGGLLATRDTRAGLASLSAAFPTLRLTDLAQHIDRIRATMLVLTRLMNTALGMLLIIATLSIVAAATVNASLRRVPATVMRALGLQRRGVYSMALLEQIMLAATGCLVGVIAVQLCAGLMFQNLFALHYRMDFVYLSLVVSSVLGLFALIGFLAGHRQTQLSPSEAFRL
ncbi:permease [Arenicella chitinivorans]|uniref:Permease n=1 Tax=Arenicella chitinivorans TaxID=1329800 RepID=A0A918RKT2_9GAMM|nr:FtsX-like permease family protein [Arenicella chitinivorans]GHA00363.1 permease [Arenicella chitinivorans]